MESESVASVLHLWRSLQTSVLFVRGKEYSDRVCEYTALSCRYYSWSRSREVEDAVESHAIDG